MFRHTIPIGRVFGIPIDLDYSWFLIAALITWMLAVNYYPAEFKGGTSPEYWLMGAVTAVLFFASIVVHELAHSWVALRYKIRVHRITLFIFGGVSQIAGEPPSAQSEFLIAVVGPLTSFALAALCFFLEPLLVNITPALAVAKYLALINGGLGLFNLIPGFPLDGGRVFRAIVWGVNKNFRRATLIAASTGRLFGFLFVVWGGMASAERERRQWIVDRLHRLVPGERSWRSGPAANGAGSIGRSQGVSGDGEFMHPCIRRHSITKASRSGGSYPRSTVLSGGRGRPRGRFADAARHEGDSSILMGDEYCSPIHDTAGKVKHDRS